MRHRHHTKSGTMTAKAARFLSPELPQIFDGAFPLVEPVGKREYHSRALNPSSPLECDREYSSAGYGPFRLLHALVPLWCALARSSSSTDVITPFVRTCRPCWQGPPPHGRRTSNYPSIASPVEPMPLLLMWQLPESCLSASRSEVQLSLGRRHAPTCAACVRGSVSMCAPATPARAALGVRIPLGSYAAMQRTTRDKEQRGRDGRETRDGDGRGVGGGWVGGTGEASAAPRSLVGRA